MSSNKLFKVRVIGVEKGVGVTVNDWLVFNDYEKAVVFKLENTNKQTATSYINCYSDVEEIGVDDFMCRAVSDVGGYMWLSDLYKVK